MKNLIFKATDRLVRAYQEHKISDLKSQMAFCGDEVFISPLAHIWSPSELSLGNKVCLHAFTHVFAGGGITLEDHVMVSSNCSITSVTHSNVSLHRALDDCIPKPVLIKRNAWLGTGAIVLPGVIIGENAIVAAGAVVTRDVDRNSVVAGVPARTVKYLSFDEIETRQASSLTAPGLSI